MTDYIAKCKHGRIIVAMVDDPRWEKETAKSVAKCIRRGLAVERVEALDRSLLGCDECRSEKGSKAEEKQ